MVFIIELKRIFVEKHGLGFFKRNTVLLAEASGDGQPQTGAAIIVRGRIVRLAEFFEDMIQLVRGNTDASVIDRKT